MFAAEPSVGKTSRSMPASGATNFARSLPIDQQVPLFDAVTIPRRRRLRGAAVKNHGGARERADDFFSHHSLR